MKVKKTPFEQDGTCSEGAFVLYRKENPESIIVTKSTKWRKLYL